MQILWLKQQNMKIKSTSQQRTLKAVCTIKVQRKTVNPSVCQSVCHHIVTTNEGAGFTTQSTVNALHKANQSESNKILAEWRRGRTSACAPPLPEHELDKVLNVNMRGLKGQSESRKSNKSTRDGRGESFFLCYLESVLSDFILLFLLRLIHLILISPH